MRIVTVTIGRRGKQRQIGEGNRNRWCSVQQVCWWAVSFDGEANSKLSLEMWKPKLRNESGIFLPSSGRRGHARPNTNRVLSIRTTAEAPVSGPKPRRLESWKIQPI